MAGSMNSSKTEHVVKVTRRSMLITNSLIKNETEEIQSSASREKSRRRSAPVRPLYQAIVQPRKKEKPKSIYHYKSTYEMMKAKLQRKWMKKYTKIPMEKQDKSIIDLKIDDEVATRSDEGHDYWDRITLEMGYKEQYEFDYIICPTSRKLGGPLSEYLLIKWTGYPRPSWELRSTLTAGITLNMFVRRQEDLDFIELRLRSILGDEEYERLFPNRYLQYEIGSGIGGYIGNKRSIYINFLRSVEWRWNHANRLSGQPQIYIEDWTNEPENYSLSNFEFMNYLCNSEDVNKILEKHNHQLDHLRCGGHCATCRVLSKQGNKHSDCCAKDGIEGVNIIECTPECGCGSRCRNNMITNGRQTVLCIFREHQKGWGVRVVQELSSGTFVSEYAGEMRLKQTLRSDPKWIYDFVLNNPVRDCNGKKVRRHLTITAAHMGNETRFLNHSCQPNLKQYTFLIERHGSWYSHVGFLSTRIIDAGEELEFDYFQGNDGDPELRMFPYCRCNSKKCRMPKKDEKIIKEEDEHEETIEEEDEDEETSEDEDEDEETIEAEDEDEDKEKSLVDCRDSSPNRKRSKNTQVGRE